MTRDRVQPVQTGTHPSSRSDRQRQARQNQLRAQAARVNAPPQSDGLGRSTPPRRRVAAGCRAGPARATQRAAARPDVLPTAGKTGNGPSAPRGRAPPGPAHLARWRQPGPASAGRCCKLSPRTRRPRAPPERRATASAPVRQTPPAARPATPPKGGAGCQGGATTSSFGQGQEVSLQRLRRLSGRACCHASNGPWPAGWPTPAPSAPAWTRPPWRP